RVDAGIHCVEKHICAVAEAELDVGIFDRKPRKPAQIRHRDAPRTCAMRTARWIKRSILKMVVIGARDQLLSLCAVIGLGFLAAEKQGRVNAPIQHQFTIFLIAQETCRSVPRKRWAHTPEAADLMRRHCVLLERSDGSHIFWRQIGNTHIRTGIDSTCRILAQIEKPNASVDARRSVVPQKSNPDIPAYAEIED